MATKTMQDLSRAMRKIDFCTLFTRTENGALAGRPMSSNGQVEYEGDSYFFAREDTRTVSDIQRDANVSLSFRGNEGFMGRPPVFITVEGRGEVIRDKARFVEHYDPDLDRYFEQGIDTSGLVLLKVHATRIHYWDGEEEGELTP